uniref:Uncharacterized protein n=1 Tax=Glossina brevipalpis TaxID=37001 RepID=A0A1A9W822_9MUSC
MLPPTNPIPMQIATIMQTATSTQRETTTTVPPPIKVHFNGSKMSAQKITTTPTDSHQTDEICTQRVRK